MGSDSPVGAGVTDGGQGAGGGAPQGWPDAESVATALFDGSRTAMSLTAVDGRVLRVNAAFAALLGRRPEELVGRLDQDLVHPGHRTPSREPGRALAGEIDGFELERCYRHADGSPVWVRLSGTLVRSADGGPSCFATRMVDATERRLADRDRTMHHQALRAVIANSRSLIYLKDLHGRYLLANAPFLKAFGVSEEDLLGRDDTFLDPELAPVWRANDLRARIEEYQVDEWIDGADGRHFYESVKFPLHDPDGVVYATGGVSVDVTAARRSTQALTRARDEALAATATKSAFLAAMSHEIRTPLNAVIGMTGLLLDTRLDPAQRDFAATAQESGEALLSVIDDVLDFSRIESGQLDLDASPFVLRDCVERAVALVAVAAHAKGLELVVQIDDTCPLLVGDAGRLGQMVTNLLTNAVKFTEAGEVVLTATVTAHGYGEGAPVRLELAVGDTGIGIAADRMDRLFRSFSQVDSSTTRAHGGTGLGLVITHRIASAMNGGVTVRSEPGVGSTFTLTVELASIPERRSVPGTAGATSLAGISVLVVDDSEANRRVLRLQLEGWGAACTDVGGPVRAIELVAGGRRFDLAVLDLQMPVMDGHELAVALRALPSGRDLRLVLMTSLQTRSRFMESPLFAAVLTKPVKSRLLHEHLTRALQEPVVPAAPRPGAQALPRGLSAVHPAPSGNAPSAAAAPERAGQDLLATGPPMRILLAEDNPVNQRVAQLVLERLGHAVETVGNGVQAVQAVLRKRYDVVLMDIQMPRMDGLQATQQIRAELPAAAQPRIIALTANALAEDRVACMDAGMDDYLAKPVRAAELAAALNRARTPARRRAGDLAPTPGPSPLVLVPHLRPPDTVDAPGPDERGRPKDQREAEHDEAAAIGRRLAEIAGPDPAEDRELFTQLLTSFVGGLPEEAEGIVAALDGTDVDDAMRRAHGLKGSAANLGADALALVCADIEAGGRLVPAVFPDDAQQRLRDATEVTVAALGHVVRRLQDPPGLAG
ncbi:MAG TPA: response regulator [Mycobacteriales bacterium]|nr:response regulator [Mycobacteriales bacterium]